MPKSLEIITTAANYSWAKGLVTIAKHRTFTVIDKAGGVGSIVVAIGDVTKAVDAGLHRENAWMIAYGVSAGPGFATGGMLFAGTLSTPIGIGVMFVYMGVSIAIACFSPSDRQTWLKRCFFSKSPNVAPTWRIWEIGQFERKTILSLETAQEEKEVAHG
jgi:hypothetical protein